MTDITTIILAAGKGTRMKSDLPKVLHKVCGLTMIEQVVAVTREIGVEKPAVVIGHGAEMVRQQLGDDVLYAVQTEQLGTGHAVMQAAELLTNFRGSILVLCGDTPLLRAKTLAELTEKHQQSGAAATVLTAVMDDPTGYGRIVRNELGVIKRIVEQKDASPDELLIDEINTGVYCFDSEKMFKALKEIKPANAQGEYYLTDLLEIFARDNLLIEGMEVFDPREVMGINNRVQLAEAEKEMRFRILKQLMMDGVTILDPDSTYIHGGVKIAPDTVIYPQTYIEGNTVLGTGCQIGPMTRLVDVTAGNGVQIQNSVILKSKIGNGTTVGPFAYIRPDTVLGEEVKVGDFVEIKKSIVGNKSKVPHLSYIGDTTIGEQVNIGAGTITCNYDGLNKWPTVVEDHAFVGSNTNLVAPVKVGKNALIAAGSTITKDIPDDALAVARNKQSNIPGWANKKNKK